jgi:signal transduction histidine kinase
VLSSGERIFLAQLNVLWPVLDPLPQAALAVSARGRLLFANRAARALVGPEPERRPIADVLAAAPLTLAGGRPITPADLGIPRALAGESVAGLELRLAARGGPRMLRVNSAPIRSPDGRSIGVLVLLAEVTELVLAEERARFLVRLGQAVVAALDPAGIGERLSGLAQETFATPCALYLVHRDASGGLLVLEPAAPGVDPPPLRLAAQRSVERREVVRDGESTAVPLLRDGNPIGAVAFGRSGPQEDSMLDQIATHATLALENARLLAESRAAADAKDAVLAVASHEITSPLAALAGYGELLARVMEEDEPDRRALERSVAAIRRTTERVQALSRRLLDSERARQGRLVVERRPGDLLPALRAVVERAAMAHQRTITFECSLPSLTGRWDLLRMEEVFENLLSNAIRYSPAPLPVHVAANRMGALLHVAVIDRGCGIPEVDRPRIFSPYSRGSNVQNAGPGLGLGLHLAAQIVRAHQGTIWFETEVGRSTTFHVQLPLE